MHYRTMIVATLVVACSFVAIPGWSADAPPPILDPSIVTDPVLGQSPQKRDEQLLAAFKAQVAGLIKTDPQTALTRCQKFSDEHPNLYPTVSADLMLTIGSLYYPALNNSKDALATYDWILKKYPGSYLGDVVMAKADLLSTAMKDPGDALALEDSYVKQHADRDDILILVADEARRLQNADRAADAQMLLKTWLPRAQHTRSSFGLGVLQEYDAILSKDNQVDQEMTVLQQAMIGNSNYLDPTAPMDEWVTTRMTELIQAQNEPEELLKWAKLRFAACAYSGASIQGASRALSAAWQAVDPSGKQKQDFVTAQSDPTAHNPLTDVPMPRLDTAFLAADLAKATGIQKITLEIISGDIKGAMANAKAMQANNETQNAGALQVCRVLKAADMNLISAAQYLRFLRGQGTDPTLRF